MHSQQYRHPSGGDMATKACDGDDPSPGGAGERTPVWTRWKKRVPPPPAANPAPDPLIPADDLGLADEPPRILLQALGMGPEGGGYLASRLAQLAAALGGESTQAATLAPFLTATSAPPPPDGSPSYLSQFLAGPSPPSSPFPPRASLRRARRPASSWPSSRWAYLPPRPSPSATSCGGSSCSCSPKRRTRA